MAIAPVDVLRRAHPSPRRRVQQRDERCARAEIRRVHTDPGIGRGLYGVRKVWHQLPRREAQRGELPGELGPIPALRGGTADASKPACGACAETRAS